jgi:hypothetical protein
VIRTPMESIGHECEGEIGQGMLIFESGIIK